MTGMKTETALTKLKRQVRLLQRQEQQGRQKLRRTLEKMRKLGKAYKSKLSKHMRMMKNKLSTREASTYIKIAADLERKLKKGIQAKKRAFALALAKIERKHAAQLTKSVSKKHSTRRKK